MLIKEEMQMFFCYLYNQLILKYGHFISDSRIKDVINKQIEIFDSTTISLYNDVMKCVGRKPKDGKRKRRDKSAYCYKCG